jgi:hypothetical protein
MEELPPVPAFQLICRVSWRCLCDLVLIVKTPGKRTPFLVEAEMKEGAHLLSEWKDFMRDVFLWIRISLEKNSPA